VSVGARLVEPFRCVYVWAVLASYKRNWSERRLAEPVWFRRLSLTLAVLLIVGGVYGLLETPPTWFELLLSGVAFSFAAVCIVGIVYRERWKRHA
jgi:hypothetical protein